jgi:hypothetical protein
MGLAQANLAIGVAIQVIFLFTDASADKISVSMFGRTDDPYRRSMGWHSLANDTYHISRQTHAWAIVGENRYDVAALVYYLREARPRVLIWRRGEDVRNHFERTVPLIGTEGEPLLLVTDCPNEARLAKYYRIVSPAGFFDAHSGPTTFRRYFAFMLRENRGGLEPLGNCL